MRICLLVLNPFDHDSRAQLISRDVARQGWQLDIIATVGGKLEEFEGAPIHRLPQPVFPFRQRRFVEYNFRAATLARQLNADIYHAVDLDTLWAAVKGAEATGGKVLYEARELYTELHSLLGRPLVRAFWRILESSLITKVDAVVTINHSIADRLSQRYSIRTPRVVLNVPSCADTIKPFDLRRTLDIHTPLILIYQGILRQGQGLERALSILSSLDEVTLVLVGDGPCKASLERRAGELGIGDRVKFAGMVSPDDLPGYTAASDAGLLLLEPTALNNYLALPQKLFQYIMACAPPIVSNLPELRAVVQTGNLGLVLEETEARQSAERIKNFLKNDLAPAKAACQAARSQYCWENEGRRLIDAYEELVK